MTQIKKGRGYHFSPADDLKNAPRQEPSRARILFGTDETVPECVSLRAGPLDLQWQGSRLCNLRLGDREIWHAVTWPVRDPDWGTPEHSITIKEQKIDRMAFSLHLHGRYPGISSRLTIEGTDAGEISVAMQAESDSDILVNRIGLCLLHPLSAAGAAVEITHDDGRLSRSTIPTLIPPWPPFMLIRAIRHEYAEGRWACCDFAGDVFEFEDQRNNADASFKTYSRSNLMPRPYRLHAGQPIRQSIRLSLDPPPQRGGGGPREARWRGRKPPPVEIKLGPPCADMPRIGIEITSTDVACATALRELRPGLLHLCVDDDPATIDFAALSSLLADTHAALRLDIHSVDALHNFSITPESVAIFPGTPAQIAALRRLFPHTGIGAGTPYFFVQLNRAEGLGEADFLSFTTSSIVHGADDASVMLGLQSLRPMVETLRARYPGKPIRIGPSGIGARRSPLGAQPPTDGTSRIALARHDPRSRGLFGAAWVLGYIAAFSHAGVEAITLHDAISPDGVRHPAFFVLARLTAPARRHEITVSDPSRLTALAVSRGTTTELLLANLTADTLDISLHNLPPQPTIAILDASTWTPAGWPPRSRATPELRLGAYAVASLLVPSQTP